jgi:hypothetical protein
VAAALIGSAVPQASLAAEAESSTLHDAAKPNLAANSSDGRSAAPENHAAGGTKPDNHAPAETGTGFKPQGGDGRQDNARANEASGEQNIKGSVAKGDGVKGPMATERSGGNDINSVRSRSGNANPIDTSIIVQPRQPFGRPNKQPGLKSNVGIVSPRNLLGRHASVPGAIDHVARNAIGIPAVRQEAVKGGDREPYGMQTAAPVSTATGSLAKADIGFDRRTVPQSNPGPLVMPAVPNRAVIDGTKLVRPSVTASGLGGPTKTIVGISGTSVRPRH